MSHMSARDDDTDPIAAEAVTYSRIRERLSIAGMVLNVAILAVALLSGASARLLQGVNRAPFNRLGSTPPYVAAAILVWSAVLFPFSFLRGHVIEHRFGLSNQSVLQWLRDWAKSVALSLFLVTPVLSGVMLAVRRYPRRWWLLLATLSLPFTVLLTNLAPILILPLFNRFEPLKDSDLAIRLRTLARGSGVEVSNVLQMDMSRQTRKANAFFTGVGRSKRIVFADTLLDGFEPDEVEVVMAHELGHQVHRDVWKLIALQMPLQLAALYATHRFGPSLIRKYGRRWGFDRSQGVESPAALPLFGLIGSAILLGAAPVVNAAIRRFIEHPADVFALEVTGNPQAFIRTMNKLGRMNLSNPHPSNLVKWLLYDHPTQQERIEFARSYVAGD